MPGTRGTNMADQQPVSSMISHTISTISAGRSSYSGRVSTCFDILSATGVSSGRKSPYVGANGKMNEFQAAMGLCNLRHVDEAIAKRKKSSPRLWCSPCH